MLKIATEFKKESHFTMNPSLWFDYFFRWSILQYQYLFFELNPFDYE